MANEDIDILTAKVQLANLESDMRAAKRKSSSTKPNKNIKVSQSEINSIKKLGKAKAREIVAGNRDSVQSGAVASFAEGVRRMYGDTSRMNNTYKPKSSPAPAASNFTYTPSVAPRVNSNARENRTSTSGSVKNGRAVNRNWSPGLHNIPNPLTAITRAYGNK
jgi:hypothetical protein